MTETVERLLTEHLDTWTAAVETKSAAGRGSSKKLKLVGIAKLRELILELAVRGQLVPQDESDEPASVLLQRIAAERERLVQEKKIKKQKPLPAVTDDEVSVELPKGWQWTRLGNIAEIGPRNILGDETEVSFVPMPLISTSYDGRHGQEVRTWSEIKKAYTHFADGDIGLAKITPCFENSKAAVFSGLKNGYGAGTTELHIARPLGNFYDSLYILLYLKAPQFLVVGQTKMTGSAGQKRVPRDFFVSNPLPLPPLSEQNRIVAKVDELMALCDALEQEQESSIAAHGLLVENLLAALTNAAGQGEFKQAWARVAAHFDTLFTTEQSVEQLKQTILQLAVMGKLVEQDAADEPAGVLLERIAAEKARLVEEKVIKKQKVLPEISDEEKVFELPEGWSWFSLSELGVFSGGKTPSKMNKDFWDGDIPWVTPKDMKVSKIYDSLDHVTNKAIESGLALFPEDALLFVVRSGILQHSFPVAITKKQCTVNQDLKVLTLIDTSLVDYVFLMMKGFEQYIIENLTKTGTTVESIQFERFSSHFFMLPPKNEQERILNLVSELVDILNKLKSNVILTRKTQLLLADVLKDQTKF